MVSTNYNNPKENLMVSGKIDEHLIFSEIKSEEKIIKSMLDKYHKEKNNILSFFKDTEEVCFIGCGSSYHAGLIEKFTYDHLVKKPSICISASELMLYPDQYINGDDKRYVFLSRTGGSSEILISSEIIKKHNKKSLSITTIKESELINNTNYSIVLENAKERSITATRSVVGTTGLLSSIIFSLSNKDHLISKISSNNKIFYSNFERFNKYIHSLICKKDYENFIFLGSGPFYGVAKEAELKVKEMSISYVNSCQPLEFRHGHKAIINNKSLITIFLSKAGFDYEIKTGLEFKKLGGEVLIIGDGIDKYIKENLNVIDIGLPSEELIKPIFYQLFGQLIGYHQAVKKEINPTNPRNLDYCVTL